jgi:hypothetical protein
MDAILSRGDERFQRALEPSVPDLANLEGKGDRRRGALRRELRA